jgi:hypothetical protein
VLQGRLNGESLAGATSGDFGSLNRRRYDAAAGLWPSVRFGRQPAPAKCWSEWLQNVTRVFTNPPRPQPIRYNGTLYVKGFRLCDITSLTGRTIRGIIPQEAFELGGLPIDCTNTKVPDQLWRTLVADRGPDGINPPAWYARACCICLDHRDVNGNLDTEMLIRPKSAPSALIAFLERVRRVKWNRKFFQSLS